MDQWLQLVRQHRAIAVIRCDNFNLAYQMAQAVAAGGINLIEITWNTNQSGKLITQLRKDLPHCTIGTGTILDLQQLKLAVDAGIQFAFAPHCDPVVLTTCLTTHKIPFIPGVFSPTEAVKAWQLGAKAVKIFPIKALGGAEYLKCLQGPLNHIPMIPSGGITIENASAMIEAGAIAVGISSNLFPQEAIVNRDWSSITTRTKSLLKKLQSN